MGVTLLLTTIIIIINFLNVLLGRKKIMKAAHWVLAGNPPARLYTPVHECTLNCILKPIIFYKRGRASSWQK